jgi:hypothetical protein
VKVTFQLPEEQLQMEGVLKAPRYATALHDMATELRQHTKHGDDSHIKQLSWDDLHEWFWGHCNANDIDPFG